METFLQAMLSAVAVVIAFVAACWVYPYLLPYRSRLMRWYMRYCNGYHRLARDEFTVLLAQYKKCAAMGCGRELGDHEFSQLVQKNKRFCSIEDQQIIQRKSAFLSSIYIGEHSSETLLKKILWNDRDRGYETYTYQCGEENIHKVLVTFITRGSFRLSSIEFLYYEPIRDFYYPIEKRFFPDDGKEVIAKNATLPLLLNKP